MPLHVPNMLAWHLWPFRIAMLIVLVLVTYFPVCSLWIPSPKPSGITV